MLIVQFNDKQILVPGIRDYYRCIESTIPQAVEAIFLRDNEGTFSFKGMVKDYGYKGYTAIGQGDSGGPIWTKTYRDGKKRTNMEEKRHTIVAVTATVNSFQNFDDNGRKDKCDSRGTWKSRGVM